MNSGSEGLSYGRTSTIVAILMEDIEPMFVRVPRIRQCCAAAETQIRMSGWRSAVQPRKSFATWNHCKRENESPCFRTLQFR